jgi:hypothetical protein
MCPGIVAERQLAKYTVGLSAFQGGVIRRIRSIHANEHWSGFQPVRVNLPGTVWQIAYHSINGSEYHPVLPVGIQFLEPVIRSDDHKRRPVEWAPKSWVIPPEFKFGTPKRFCLV